RLTDSEPEMLVRGETQWQLRRLFWRDPETRNQPFRPARHDWIDGLEWMIARQDPSDHEALVLAAKGGHNSENHNQNDVGNIIVHVRGESVIADPGAGRYTAEYFGPTRYEHFVNSSRGHSVPVVNGQEQGVGARYVATVLEHREDDLADVLALELKDAYPDEADLASLRRTITLHRDAPGGAVTLDDHVRFATKPGSMESVLISFGRVELLPGVVELRGDRGALRVTYDADAVVARHEVVRDVPFKVGESDVQRVVFALREPVAEGSVSLRIEPM
ncbi:MAG TPA: heparinase II/III family protein, partial [Thermomicrobiales bacterium]|nr:heparinase II/III family protein [Thermomicrobiales bacterium]